MVSLDDAVIIRHKISGENYEVFVDADLALAFRGGEEVDIGDVVAVESVFKDAKAGDNASEEHLLDLFKAQDMRQVIADIVKKGELHLTTEQKKRMLEERRRQVASIITRNAINPQTNTPHPLGRIEKAMDEARVEIVLSKSAKEQVDKVVKALKPIIPIKFERLQVAVSVPAEFAGKLYHRINDYGQIRKEEWVGSEQVMLIEIPAGVQDELYNYLNGVTRGMVKTKVVRHE
jgi:ribosome maturation protein SDO1